ncbi:MAG: DNA polymerase III subunit gamma/tau [Anaerolineae bacterium]|nr:DNA polymerase III subunit gamma/tau [Anaerolineae bacterium]
MAQALYRKWRPKSFDEVVGQEHVTTTLKNQIASGRIGHAYLFVGSRGCGKTTTARIFAREVNLAHLDPNDPRTQQLAESISEGRALDVIEIDAASHTSVDDVREIRERVNFQPSELRYKVYIIDEVHMLSTAAFNALLKTLEEPPPHVIFILATTDPQKIPATVLSRCQRFNFRRVPAEKIIARLRQLCDAEGIEADDAALRLIARQATGSLRDAVSLLDQLASSTSMRITAADVRDALGASDAATLNALVEGLIHRDPARGLEAIQAALDQGADPRQIARQTVEYLRLLTQLKADSKATLPEVSEAERIEMAAHAERLSVPQLITAIRAFSEAIAEMRSTTETQLPLEVAYLRCVVESSESRPHEVGDAPAPQPKARAPKRSPSAVAEPSAAAPTDSDTRTHAQAEPVTPERLSPSAPEARLTVELLREQWQRLIDLLNKSNQKPVAALLRSCKPYAVLGDVIQLAADHDLIQERLQKPEARGAVVAGIAKLFGKQYDLEVFVQGRTPASAARQEDDPVIRKLEQLGGRVQTQARGQSL